MNKQEIESLVLSVVDRVLNGSRVEDSLIECKAEWPEPAKARQLAAHANSARGEEIVWIIGIDEARRALTSPPAPDLSDWWSRMSSRFDDNVAPDLRELNVPINDQASVAALIFSTDRAPYVIKVGQSEGRVEREVPIRAGTRTRSAYRHELLRLLHPAATPPPAYLTNASLIGRRNADTSVRFHFNAYLFIEQRVDEIVMLPHHLMYCKITPAPGQSGEAFTLHLNIDTSTTGTFGNIGIWHRQDGLIVSGGAVIHFISVKDIKTAYAVFGETRAFELELTLALSGGERPISVREKLTFTRQGLASDNQQEFGRWSFPGRRVVRPNPS